MRDTGAALALAEMAASSDTFPRRAGRLPTVLRRVVPYDSAWPALPDPDHPRYQTLASADLDVSTLAFVEGPQQARDMEATAAHRVRRTMSPSDRPYPTETLPGWAECLMPAGYREGFAVALYAPGGRHVGFLGTLADDALLAVGSPALAPARAELEAGRVHLSFLWPLGGRHAPHGHARITAVARAVDLPLRLIGIVAVSPPGDILAKLSASSRTLAAVRAERAGLYVPSQRRPP